MLDLYQINKYQEQAYLLDPYLERLVSPLAAELQTVVHHHGPILGTEETAKFRHYCRLLYVYTKVRGYKLVCMYQNERAYAARFLPHEVSDLLPLLALLEHWQSEIQGGTCVSWECLYILLLWLSLVALVPFKLCSEEHEASPAERMEKIARFFLSRPGKERDAASVLLGRLYRRRDVAQSLVSPFLNWAQSRLQISESPFEVREWLTQVTGILQTLCAITKDSDASFAQQHMEAIDTLLQLYLPWTDKSMLVDRYRTKLFGRLAMQLLARCSDDERVDGLVDTLLNSLGHAVRALLT